MAIQIEDLEKYERSEFQVKKERKNSLLKKVLLGLVAAASIGSLVAYNAGCNSTSSLAAALEESQLCPIHNKVAPSGYYKDNSTVEYILKNPDFKKLSVEKFSGALQIDTSVFDQAPAVDADPDYWKNFAVFHKYLQKTFGTVYDKLKVETVNTYGLVYTWEGSDTSLKPLLLTAHQDVVPVQEDTIKDWDYPPFEGHFDGKMIYGRGAGDCKNLLIGLLETLEVVIAEGFTPKRTLVLAFGADEEISGHHFAANIGTFLEERYGKDSFYAIIDEGMGNLEKMDDIFIASPATAEKGYTDIKYELTTPGGHSSVPPDHTSIGIMSELITTLESNPFDAILSTNNPALEYLQCVAKYSSAMDKTVRKNLLRAGFDKIANSKTIEYFSSNRFLKYLIRTSQAIDIIQGGAKSNALPEHVSVIANHRIAFESSVQATFDRSLSFVKQVAEKYDLGVVAADGTEYLKPTANGYFTITINDQSEPTQVSPTTSDVWALYSGALRHFYEDLVFEGSLEKPIIVAPNVPTGNTDTRHYLNLTQHIYRSIPGYAEGFTLVGAGIHSVNEKMDMDMHLQIIAFYYEYLHLVLDEEAK